MLFEGYAILTQDQLNMLALTAEPFEAHPWDPPFFYTGYPVQVAPEWPEKLELGSWVAFCIDGTLYAFQPEVIKANLERTLMESSMFFPSQAIQDYTSVGLFQQRSIIDYWGIT